MDFFDVSLNCILVSIPEEILIVIIALSFLGVYEFDNKQNIKLVLTKMFLILVLPSIILSNIFMFGMELNMYIRVALNILVLTTCLMIYLKSKNILSILGFSILSIGIIIVIEILWAAVAVYIFGFDLSISKQRPLTNFIWTLPMRILEYVMLYILYSKKDTIKNVSLIEIIRNDTPSRKWIILFFVIDLFILVYISNNVLLKNSLGSNSFFDIKGILVIFVLVILTVVSPWITLGTIYTKNKDQEKSLGD